VLRYWFVFVMMTLLWVKWQCKNIL
jgi:hypothetical protein